MKKIAGVIIFLILVFITYPHPSTFANQDLTQPSLADAVYADLALRNYLDNVSVFMLDSNNNQEIDVNKDRQWIPASTVKMFVAMYAYKQIADGTINTTDPVTITAENVVPTELVTDDLPTLQENQTVTVERLLKQMITQSDNTAYNTLLDLLDRQAIVEYIHSLGLTHTAIGSKLNLDDTQEQVEEMTPGFGINTTTAQDYAAAFELIREKKIPGSDDLFALLKEQRLNNMIPLLLPKGIVVAHKTGDLDPNYHDGGIIIPAEDKKPYILAIFTNLGDPNIVAHISQLVYTNDYQLVGSVLSASDSMPTQEIDELMRAKAVITPTPTPKQNVLGANTLLQNLTASDLGIKPSDLSLAPIPAALPRVWIPADSIWYNTVTLWYFLKGLVANSPSQQVQVQIDKMHMQIAQAGDLIHRNQTDQANSILTDVQKNLSSITQDKSVASNTTLQTGLESVSQQRFEVLNSEFQQATPTDRINLIKVIASQAKETTQKVEPNLPQAINITSPAQHPLVGTVTNTTSTQLTVQTAGGQTVTVPINNSTKVRAQDQTEPTSTTTIDKGTTVALVGTIHDTSLTPTFIMTNLPRELVAPQPLTVVKVNTKNNTIIVSENGVLTQVDLTKRSVIKAGDTDLTLGVLKPGDTVIIQAQPIIVEPNEKLISPTLQITQEINVTNSVNSTHTLNPSTKTNSKPTLSLTPAPSSASSAVLKPTSTPQSTNNQKPNVVVGKTVEVIQTKQQQKIDAQIPKPKPQTTNISPASKDTKTEPTKKPDNTQPAKQSDTKTSTPTPAKK